MSVIGGSAHDQTSDDLSSIFRIVDPEKERVVEMTTILVSSGGGHLQEMVSLAPRLNLRGPILWVSPSSGLTQELLQSHEYFSLPYHPPRDWRGAISLVKIALDLMRRCGARRVISTGALPAAPFFLAGARLGLDLHYIESATRTASPSMSGRLVSLVPTANLYAQYEDWTSPRWHFSGNVFDPFRVDTNTSTVGPISRVVVSLGTEHYPFSRAVQRLQEILPREAEVLWQTGNTSIEGLGINGRASIPASELQQAIAEADVVVSHAGVGSAITALDLGKVPVLLPREARFGEHVDDHQRLIARELRDRGLAVAVPVEKLTSDHLNAARSQRVLRQLDQRPFRLVRQEGMTDPGRTDGDSDWNTARLHRFSA